MAEPRFKGGPIFLNSGGTGPDDYLLKPIKGGRWYRVICRYGRHFQGDRAAAEADRDAHKRTLEAGVQRVCVGDNARRWHRMHGGDREKMDALTLTASEFWAKYGGDYQPGNKCQISTTISEGARILLDRLCEEDHRTIKGELEYLIIMETRRRAGKMILKRYFDEDDWQEISEDEARRTLEPFYSPVEGALEEIAKGHIVHTCVAEFKRVQERAGEEDPEKED